MEHEHGLDADRGTVAARGDKGTAMAPAHRVQPRQRGPRQHTAAQQPGSCQFGAHDPRLKQYQAG